MTDGPRSSPFQNSGSPPGAGPPAPHRTDPAGRNPADDADSARAFLESLERERGTKLLSQAEFEEMRRWVLLELARGPRLQTSTLMTFSVVGLILFVFLLFGLHHWLQGGPSEWLLAVSSGACLGLWGWVLRRYVVGIRQQARMSIQQRLDEVEDLRRGGLITREEFEEVYSAILSSRVTSG